jgi:DNA-binding response OmpR family regulator
MTQGPDALLIVDDDPMIRDVMLRYFSEYGFNAFPESSGKGALEWIDSHHVDLVLLDIEMPGMDGLELLKILRKTYTPIKLPVIMVTGRTSSDDFESALAAGANDYITKPIDFSVLLTRVQIHMLRKHAKEVFTESEKHYTFAARGAKDSSRD